MNTQSQQQQSDFKSNLKSGIGIAQCLAMVMEAWLRIPGSCGSRYFGGQAVIGWVMLLLVATFSRSGSLLQFWAATGVCFLLHRIAHFSRQRQGYCPHSRYVGLSYFHHLGGNRLAYTFWEPLLTLLVGIALTRNGDSYGRFVVVLAISLWISARYTVMSEEARIVAIQDARSEQAWLADYTKRS